MKPGPILLDTNLLLLFVVGRIDPNIVGRHKNLRAYTVADYELLIAQLRKATRILVTPNILTETSNLLAQIGEPDRTQLFTGFQTLIQAMNVIDEFHVPSTTAAGRGEFVRLGLADAVALVEHDDDFTLLTVDGPLYHAALAAGRKATNFTHLRELS